MVFRRTGKTYVGVAPSKKRVKRFKKSLRTEPRVANHAPLDEVVADRGSVQAVPGAKTQGPRAGDPAVQQPVFYEELGLVRLGDRRRMSRPHALT